MGKGRGNIAAFFPLVVFYVTKPFFTWDMSYFTWLKEVWQWRGVTHLQNQDSVTVLSMGNGYINTNALP